MSEEKRESELDINELLRKYLPDEYGQDNEEQRPQRRRRASARRVPAPAAGTVESKNESDGSGAGSAGDTRVIKSADADDVDAIDAVRENIDVGVSGLADEEKQPLGDVDTVSTEDVPDATFSFEPDEETFAQYENDGSDSYDYIGDESDGDVGDVDDVKVAGGADGEVEADEDDESMYDLGGDDDIEVDPFDMNILLGLGMDEELEQAVGAEKVSKFVEKQQDDMHRTESLKRERAELEYEYTTKSQTREVVEMYNSRYKQSKIKLAAAAVLTFILLLFECHSTLGITLSGALDPVMYPVVYVMVGLQILLFIAAMSYKSIIYGFRDFFRGRPTPECVAGFALVVTVVYDAAISFLNIASFGDSGPETFHLPVAIGMLLLILYQWMNLRREILSFGIVSSKKKKYVLTSLSMADSKLEHEAFSDLMEEGDRAEDISVLKIEGADFVEDYFLRTNRYPNGRKFIGFIIPAMLVVAAVFFAVEYRGGETSSMYAALKAAASSAIMCLPVSVFYMFSHPFYRAVSKAHEDDCTIIGEGSVEEYADAAIVSFDDKNVFPSTGVNVRGINVFGNNRIDRVLYMAASVFCTVGGPLADVFDLATRDIGHSENVELVRCMPGLLETTVDGSSVIFGSLDAIEASGIRIPRPLQEHRNDEFGGSVSIMYMVQDGKFVSRMLISYLVDADFEFILKQLDRGGMFVGIKTFDPNVTEEFLGRQIKLKRYPVRIIRCKSLEDRTEVEANVASGLVSKDSPKTLLQTVTLCEKVLHARSINTMLAVISVMISVFVSILAIIFGAGSLELSPMFITIYQLFWVVPMFITSKMIVS